MAKAPKFFIIAEFVYNLAIPAARSRKMVSLADPSKVPAQHYAEYLSYQNGVFCFAGSFLLLLFLPTLISLVAAAGLAFYGYRQVEKIYPSLSYNIASIMPTGLGREAMMEHLAKKMAEAEFPDRAIPDDKTLPEEAAWQAPRAQSGEIISGSGPWMVYVIDDTGAERRLPRRFEDEGAAQRHADIQLATSRGKLQHSGVVYAPEN